MKSRGTGFMTMTVVLAVLASLWVNGDVYGQTGQAEAGVLHITRKLGQEEAKDPVKPGDGYWDRDGTQYGLERYEVKEVPGHMTKVSLEKQVVYLGVEGAGGLPESISVQEECSGQPAEGELSLREARMTGEEWRDGFSAPVTFHSYGADGYEAGSIVIDSQDMLAGAVKAQNEILGMMGLKPEEYRILTMEWAGDPFEDEEGQTCRQATARGQKLVRDYETTYEGEVAYMEPVSYEMEMVYRPVLPLPAAEVKEQPEPTGQGLSTAAPSEPEKGGLWYWVHSGFVITVGAGLVGMAVGIVILIAAWVKQRQRERQKKRLPEFRG